VTLEEEIAISMFNRSYSEIQGFLNQVDMSQLPKLNICVLRNIMVEPIEPYLRYLGHDIGFNLEVNFGEYDNIFQEAVGGKDKLLNEETDFVLIFSKLETLSRDLSLNYTALNADGIKTEVSRIEEYIKNVLAGIRRQTNAVVLWHGFELPVYPALGILDSQSSMSQRTVINSLNEFLRNSLQNHGNAYFVDLNLCMTRLGFSQFYDYRFWHIGRAPYTRQALCEIAMEDFKFIRSLKGKSKKCFVLDCDNILWGGIIGEDGLAGIKLGQTYPGSAYYEFQQEVLNLYNRGVILALCSKNNEDDVWEVFRKHPDMILREKHIAAAQINWRDKAANIRQIAVDLNIGLDSLVFIDDSEFEVNLIRNTLPEVEVIHMPQTRLMDYRNILASCGLFDTLTISNEDKNRTTMYRAEAARRNLQVQATDLKTYLKTLEMEVDIRFADEFSIPRIAQLTQKTNQFNLTTKRYSEADIESFSNSDQSDVIYLKLKDRFGDSGIVGVCILTYRDKKSIFDTFLLSCRVLGREVEDVFLIQVLKLAKKRGCEAAIGEYYPSPKNNQVRDFYINRGFKKFKENQSNGSLSFRCELSAKEESRNDLFHKINSEIDR
jgi:FkbH-like protein